MKGIKTMIKRKYLLKDIELTKVENDVSVTLKADQCFTEESYIVVKLPTYSEKLAASQNFKGQENDAAKTFEIMNAMVIEVDCVAIDNSEKITTFDDLTAFSDGGVVIEWMGALMRTGFVPKKSLTV